VIKDRGQIVEYRRSYPPAGLVVVDDRRTYSAAGLVVVDTYGFSL
jgi:hypothetical protein